MQKKRIETSYPNSPPLEKAVIRQSELPQDFILKGFITNQWLKVLMKHDRSSAERLMVHLFLSLWKILFTQIWDARNNELHGKKSIVETYERSILRKELVEWRHNAAAKIGAHQAYLAEYNLDDVDKWPTTAMKNVAETLAYAARNYNNSVLNRQPLITTFFTPANMEPD